MSGEYRHFYIHNTHTRTPLLPPLQVDAGKPEVKNKVGRKTLMLALAWDHVSRRKAGPGPQSPPSGCLGLRTLTGRSGKRYHSPCLASAGVYSLRLSASFSLTHWGIWTSGSKRQSPSSLETQRRSPESRISEDVLGTEGRAPRFQAVPFPNDPHPPPPTHPSSLPALPRDSFSLWVLRIFS